MLKPHKTHKQQQTNKQTAKTGDKKYKSQNVLGFESRRAKSRQIADMCSMRPAENSQHTNLVKIAQSGYVRY
jgi:hypothetical protein